MVQLTFRSLFNYLIGLRNFTDRMWSLEIEFYSKESDRQLILVRDVLISERKSAASAIRLIERIEDFRLRRM